MESSGSLALTVSQQTAIGELAADLRRIFGTRLQVLVAYGLQSTDAADGPRPDSDQGLLHSLALVDRLRFEDLAACLPLRERWRRQQLAVPLLLAEDEFHRTLDVFPLEYGDIIAHHTVIEGNDPFQNARIADRDVRRACELQAKSHLIHLREGFLESGGDPRRVAQLIAASAPAFRTLLANISRLDTHETETTDEAIASAAERTIGIPASLVREVLASLPGASTIADPTVLLARYLAASERVWQYVDAWRGE